MKYRFISHSGAVAQARPRSDWKLPDGTRISELKISPDVLNMMPESVARENDCLPVHSDAEILFVVHCDTEDIHLQDKLRFLLNREIQFVFGSRRKIRMAIERNYGATRELSDSYLADVDSLDADECEFEYAPSQGAFGTGRRRHMAGQSEFSRERGILKKMYSLNPGMAQYATNRSKDSGDGMFYYTVREGQKALAYRKDGNIDVIEGPARVWKGSTQFYRMERKIAHPGEFLVVRNCDGSQENVRGPAEVWFDPRIHADINSQKGLTLAAKEAVVVYGENEGETKRRIVHGPGLFIPQPGEWLHEFSWHASKGGSKGVDKKPNGLQFQKLWLMPDQMYHDVKDVRTADDAVLVIRLMIFFELLDIEKMLDTTHDPIGDFINATTSDVVEFTGKRSFDQFKQQTEQLNELKTYSQLLHRAEQCGYRINNVVYRGYGAPDSLQKMHDEAIAARTSLQLDKETEKQTQELEDYRLQCQVERSQRRRSEQTTEVEHDIEMQQKRELAKIEAEKMKLEFKREQARMDAQLQNENHAQADAQKREHLNALRTMGVELTEYLTQGRADQVIELRGRGGSQPHLHVNQNGNGKKPK